MVCWIPGTLSLGCSIATLSAAHREMHSRLQPQEQATSHRDLPAFVNYGPPPPPVQTPAVYRKPCRWHSWARSASPSAQARRRASCRSGDTEQPDRTPAKSRATIASLRTTLRALLVAKVLNHLIRPLQERRRDRQAEALGGLEVGHVVEVGLRPSQLEHGPVGRDGCRRAMSALSRTRRS
jgi:hypothetical protein